MYSPADECSQQHLGGPEDGAAGSQRGVETGTTRLPGTHPAVCEGQSIMGSREERVKEPRCSGEKGNRNENWGFFAAFFAGLLWHQIFKT